VKKTLRLFITIIYSLSVFVFAVAIEAAEDPVTADPQHYKVEFENDQVRVLRVTYGPGEKSVMHYHPAGVAVFLTDHHVKFTFPDGRSEERNAKAKETLLHPAGDHIPENLSDEPLELILVELKAK
jgi:quercetin dioxygenase-like cupin family protein